MRINDLDSIACVTVLILNQHSHDHQSQHRLQQRRQLILMRFLLRVSTSIAHEVGHVHSMDSHPLHKLLA
jgi:hypothetical protein